MWHMRLDYRYMNEGWRCWVTGSGKRRLGLSSVRARLPYGIFVPAIFRTETSIPGRMRRPWALSPALNTEQDMGVPGEILMTHPGLTGGGRTGTRPIRGAAPLLQQIFSCRRSHCLDCSEFLASDPTQVSAQPTLYCTYRCTFRPSSA